MIHTPIAVTIAGSDSGGGAGRIDSSCGGGVSEEVQGEEAEVEEAEAEER